MFDDGIKYKCRLCWQFIIDVSDHQQCPYPLPYIKRGTVHPLVTLTIIPINPTQKATCRLDVKAITRQEGPNQYKSFVSLHLLLSSAYAEALQTLSRVTPWWVAGHQTPTSVIYVTWDPTLTVTLPLARVEINKLIIMFMYQINLGP